MKTIRIFGNTTLSNYQGKKQDKNESFWTEKDYVGGKDL